MDEPAYAAWTAAQRLRPGIRARIKQLWLQLHDSGLSTLAYIDLQPLLGQTFVVSVTCTSL